MIKDNLICRSCSKPGIEVFWSLGEMPLANSLLTCGQLGQLEPKYPLDLAYCPHCTLVQITETVSPEKLFREYLYFSSFSDTVVTHAREMSDFLIESRGLNGQSLVVEIASNDGYLLQHYQKAGVPVLGIEPAANIARVAEEKRGIRTLCEFFGRNLGQKLRDEKVRANVVHASNVLAHVPDLNSVVEGLKLILADDGIAVIEVPYVKDMVDNGEFDTIYHEHLCYFSLTSLRHLFQRHGMVIFNVTRELLHGGSLRIFVAPADRAEECYAVRTLLREEARWGVDRLPYYEGFSARADGLRKSLRDLLQELKQNGKRIAAYGAAAKGTVLLNYCGMGTETLDFVVDRSTYKQDLYMPGVRVPIYSPDKLLEAMPDYVLMLAWNFADEIMRQQTAYRSRGGKFIIPLPELRII